MTQKKKEGFSPSFMELAETSVLEVRPLCVRKRLASYVRGDCYLRVAAPDEEGGKPESITYSAF